MDEDEISFLLKLCLTDRSFPAFVQQIDHRLKTLTNESTCTKQRTNQNAAVVGTAAKRSEKTMPSATTPATANQTVTQASTNHRPRFVTPTAVSANQRPRLLAPRP